MKETLNDYLAVYANWQKDVLVCQNFGNGWAKRTTIDKPDWMPNEHYNHRNILDNEVVVEFDDKDDTVNGTASGFVCEKLRKHGFSFSAWFSGGKSVHVHSFWDIKEATDIRLIKRLITAWLCSDVGIKPDYQVCVRRHLIRAEFGLHEKTKKYKSRLVETVDYPVLNTVPQIVWDQYDAMRKKSIDTKLNKSLVSLEASPMVQVMLDTASMRVNDDGRERILFVLIHVLKPKYKVMDELAETLQSWYRYSGGKKLGKRDIYGKVKYHWNRNYNITEKYLKEVLEDVGLE